MVNHYEFQVGLKMSLMQIIKKPDSLKHELIQLCLVANLDLLKVKESELIEKLTADFLLMDDLVLQKSALQVIGNLVLNNAGKYDVHLMQNQEFQQFACCHTNLKELLWVVGLVCSNDVQGAFQCICKIVPAIFPVLTSQIIPLKCEALVLFYNLCCNY